MGQDYTRTGQPIGRQRADIEPLKSRSQVATEHMTIDLDDATLANLETVRRAYDLPNLDAAAQVVIAQRIQRTAKGGKA